MTVISQEYSPPSNIMPLEKQFNKNVASKDKISKDELQLVEKLRSMVKKDLSSYYDTNYNLLRWIQGHSANTVEVDLEDVAKKLRLHLKVRRSSWGLDSLSNKERDHAIHKHWMYGITGQAHTLENVIVNIEQCGQTDYAGMSETFSIQDILKARTKDLEDMLAAVMDLERRTGKQASILYVMDMSDLRYDKRLFTLVRGSLRALSGFMSEHYVELVKYFVLVNVPSYISAVWMLAKPILPEKTRQKVRILSSSNWREQILEYCSATSLPSKWNLEDDGEELFQADIDSPIPFPLENYFRNLTLDTTDKEKLRVAAGKSLVITRELKKGEHLKWWILADGDFGMGIFHCQNTENTAFDEMEISVPYIDLIPTGPSEAPLSEKLVAEHNAFYKIRISNESAWLKAINILCKIDVIPADNNSKDCDMRIP